MAADRAGPAEQRLDAILDALSNALQIELHVYADCEVQRVNLLASVLKRKPIAPLKAEPKPDAAPSLLTAGVRDAISFPLALST